MHYKNVSLKLSGLLALGSLSYALPAQATTYYVTPGGPNNSASVPGTSEATAINWQSASNLANADPATNDTIVFLPGTYDRTKIGATGRDDCLISVPTNVTVKAKYAARDNATNRSILKGIFNSSGAATPQYQYFVIDGTTQAKANIVVDGFEIDGSTISGTTGKSEAAGISLKDDCTHITLSNNVIHDTGGGGLGSFNYGSAQSGSGLGSPGGADYVTVFRNQIYNCCRWFTGGGGGSGISLLGLSNTGPTYEDTRTVHNFIQRNKVYNCNTATTGATAQSITDNNGIIIDLAGGFSPDSSQNRHPAQTLIENNVVYGNDGRGIHVFKSCNVLARNNTCYNNLQLPQFTSEGELSASFAKDVLFVNNVAYADGTNHPLNSYMTDGYGTGNGNVVFRYNATGNGTNSFATGTSNYGNVTGLTASAFNSDYSNKVLPDYTVAAQKAIDVGSAATSSVANNNDFAPNDYYGTSRPVGVQVDRGAFETSVSAGTRATSTTATSSAGHS